MADVMWAISRHCDELQGIGWLNPTHVFCANASRGMIAPNVFTLSEIELASSAASFGLSSSIPDLATVERILSAKWLPDLRLLVLVDGCPTSYEPFRRTLRRALLRQSLAVLVARGASSACLRGLFDRAKSEVFRVRRIPPVLVGPEPVSSEQRGNLLFLQYRDDVPVDELLHLVLQTYAVPWMGDLTAPRGEVPAAVRRWIAGAAGALAGVAASYLAQSASVKSGVDPS